MKRIISIIAVIAVCVFCAFCQTNVDETHGLNYTNVPILKVYDHVDAYVVLYRKNGLGVGRCSIPKEWFKQGRSTTKARVRALPESLSPYLTIIFQNNEFYNVYLNMPFNRQDKSWGVLNSGADLPEEINPKKVASGL